MLCQTYPHCLLHAWVTAQRWGHTSQCRRNNSIFQCSLALQLTGPLMSSCGMHIARSNLVHAQRTQCQHTLQMLRPINDIHSSFKAQCMPARAFHTCRSSCVPPILAGHCCSVPHSRPHIQDHLAPSMPLLQVRMRLPAHPPHLILIHCSPSQPLSCKSSCQLLGTMYAVQRALHKSPGQHHSQTVRSSRASVLTLPAPGGKSYPQSA